MKTTGAELATARDELTGEIGRLRDELLAAESARDTLSQQVEQLTAENAAIQDQLVESDRLRVETSENQGHALSELAHRLSLVENERARLEADLGEALTALERAQAVAERTARGAEEPLPAASVAAR